MNFNFLSKIPRGKTFSFFLIISIFFFTQLSCDRPGGEDDEGRSYTYGLQITSVVDDEDRTSYIIFDMSSENVGTNEQAEVTVANVFPSNTGGTTPSGGDSGIFAYDETDSVHLTAYKVEYFIDGFWNIESYIGRINVNVPAGESVTFDILLITGETKLSILDSLDYTHQKGYIRITLSGYDGDGNEKSRSVDVDAFVYTYERITPTPSPTATPTITSTQTQTATPTLTATPTAT